MDALELLRAAEKDGVTITLVENDLRIEASQSKSFWIEKLQPYKQDLVAHLSGMSPADHDEQQPTCDLSNQPFPTESLPAPVSDFVQSASKAIGCDPAFVALPLICCLARAIGNSRVIRLKRTWTEPAIIWAAIVGKSGTHKTPALQAATKIMERMQAEAVAEYTEAMRTFELDQAKYDRAYQQWKRKGKKDDQPPWQPVEPTCVRYMTSDCTIEALVALLASQFHGLIVVRDELAGWLAGIAEYKGGKGSDLGHWLACWSASPLTVDRKTGAKKLIHVPRAAVNLVGGIQPDILRRAIGREHLEDGLCARLLLAMPEPRTVVWSEAVVDPGLERKVQLVFGKLFSLEPAADEHGKDEPFPVDLTPEAKRAWIDYFNRHRSELVDLDDDLAAAWTKLEAYTARFALIFQLCSWAAGDTGCNQIDEASMQAAIKLSDWFGVEARRVYGLLAENERQREERALVELIQRKGGTISTRELAHCCRKYREPGTAESALSKLGKAGLGKFETVATGSPGRPGVQFVLNAVTVTKTPVAAEKSNSVTVTRGS